MLFAIINLCIFALVCLLVVVILEWVAGMFGVPAHILKIVRAIVALIFLLYVLAVLFGGAEPPMRMLRAVSVPALHAHLR